MMEKSLSSRRYYFNSSARTAISASSSDFTVTLANAIDPRYNAMVIRKVNIPMTYYTINSNNNKLYWTDNVGDALITSTLTSGSYTPSTLATMIGTIMTSDTANSQTYTVTSSSTTFKFTFSGTGAFKIYGYTYRDPSYKGCWEIIGAAIDNTGASAYNMANVYNLQPTNNFYVESNLATSTSFSKVGAKNIAIGVPINVNFGSILHYEPQTFNPIPMNNIANNVTFRLVDDNFNVADLNGANWDIEIDFLYY